MRTRMMLAVPAFSITLLTIPSFAAAEVNTGWKFEVTPYVWAAGVSGDVEVRDRTASIDTSFSDIFDHLDMAAAFLGTAQYNSWVTWAQVDYLALSGQKSSGDRSVSLDSKLTMATLGFGYQFQGWSEHQTFDVLLGVRSLHLDNELKTNNLGSFDNTSDVIDPVIIVRPSIQLSERWRFNPTLSYGTGGDSNETWELEPQFQFQAWENAAFRFGYRKLYYDIDTSRHNNFDGAFEGPFVGVGFTFGGSPKSVAEAPPPSPAPVIALPKDTDGDGVSDDKDQCPKTPAGDKVDSIGCSFGIRVEAIFDTNSAVIKPESFEALDRAVDLLKRVPSMRGVIEGHTDSSGSAAHNQKLSERRAAAVSEYLVKHGIDTSRVPAQGLGESQPAADNATPEGRALNRRVVLRRTDGGA